MNEQTIIEEFATCANIEQLKKTYISLIRIAFSR